MRLSAGQPVRPYAFAPAQRVQAGNAVQIDITSLDWDNEKEAPLTLQYRIDDLSDLVVILDWTTVVAPGETSTVTIPASLNTMYSQYRDVQTNQVTFKATYADGSQAQVVGIYELNQIYTANMTP